MTDQNTQPVYKYQDGVRASPLHVMGDYPIQIELGDSLTTTSSDFEFDMLQGVFSNTRFFECSLFIRQTGSQESEDPSQQNDGGDYHFDFYVVVSKEEVQKASDEGNPWAEAALVAEEYGLFSEEHEEFLRENELY